LCHTFGSGDHVKCLGDVGSITCFYLVYTPSDLFKGHDVQCESQGLTTTKPSMPSRLVKHLPHSLDVLAQARVIDELKNRQVDLVGYGGLVKAGGNSP
jgi:hypothetical protein